MTSVIIPWRPTPSRRPAFETVSAWYRRHLPGATIVPVDSDDEIFNLSRCRNIGIATIADPAEVVVISDADTFPEPAPLAAAIAAAAGSGRVHLPYTEYRWLGEAGTAQLLTGAPATDCAHEVVVGARSGVYVTTPATWWAHGGQDERFRGWGFEDTAWWIAHETLLGEPVRHPGRVFAMHHVTQRREGEQYDRNAELAGRYRAASGDPAAMRELVFAEGAAAESAANARSAPGRA
ncbi:MAG TPA: hypothetical protein VN759_09040 [Pseudolysinimonas sp.]|nr:hypothetical protein [Pseudolysinimonas sp.]